MKYLVHAVREQVVTIEVEADDAEDAKATALDEYGSAWDVWDTNVSVTMISPL